MNPTLTKPGPVHGVPSRRLDDADDIAAVIHDRVAKAAARPAGSGRTRKAPRLIAGLIPEAIGTMTPDMRRALDERRDLIETRTDALVSYALNEGEAWVTALGAPPTEARAARTWRRHARTVAAYRDRYRISGTSAPGAAPDSAAQKIDAAKARASLNRAQEMSSTSEPRRTRSPAIGRTIDL